MLKKNPLYVIRYMWYNFGFLQQEATGMYRRIREISVSLLCWETLLKQSRTTHVCGELRTNCLLAFCISDGSWIGRAM